MGIKIVVDGKPYDLGSVENITPEMIGAVKADNPVFAGSISMGRSKSGDVGINSTALGNNSTAIGDYSYAQGTVSAATGANSHAEGTSTKAIGNASHAEGYHTTAEGYTSHAEGDTTTAVADRSHAEGNSTTASENAAHAEGNSTTASGPFSHAEGNNTTASASGSHAEGVDTTASASGSHAEGNGTNALAVASHAGGYYVSAEYARSTAIGSYNVLYSPSSTSASDRYYFVVGKGTNSSARANAFRVTADAAYGVTSWKASGADYAEMFEWQDANPNNEDRAGLFVTLDGDQIRIATPEDDYILGIVSAAPSVCGDVYDDQWSGMFETDIFGRPIYETVEVPDEVDLDGNIIDPAHSEEQQKLNPNYDHTQRYLPRSKRSEWDAVGLLGKLVTVDDGSCVPSSYCKPGINGAATHSSERTKFRVLKRLDDTHILVLIL